MKCPFCGSEDLKVTDSRNAVELNAIRRRRECLGCGRRFTTFETVELTMQVHKRDGRYEDFQEQKLLLGLESACRHTSISHESVRALALKISTEIMERQTREISSKEIGEMVMKYLKTMDMIAYIRFACVYRRFRDIEELMEAIHSVSPDEIDIDHVVETKKD
ncbi:MAG: transcriptional repressor NrdR [Verrucomicrobia bacterium]|nr:transcriptional repressor NrdR [Verrucomicrobiota bacterium]MBS0646592.1 transcriptional repressor NrdR [Verrucomicrobiota bacterium]